MTAILLLGFGLEYVDAVFQTIQNSSFSQYTIAGMKTLAVLFFLINILKKYNEGIADKDGYSWGLSPGELVKNFAIVILVIFSTQVLGFFDAILVAVEGQYEVLLQPYSHYKCKTFPLRKMLVLSMRQRMR